MARDRHDTWPRTASHPVENVCCPTAAVVDDGGRGEYRCGCCFRTFEPPEGER